MVQDVDWGEDLFARYTSEALNLEVAGYLDLGEESRSGAVTGEDLYEMARQNMEPGNTPDRVLTDQSGYAEVEYNW